MAWGLTVQLTENTGDSGSASSASAGCSARPSCSRQLVPCSRVRSRRGLGLADGAGEGIEGIGGGSAQQRPPPSPRRHLVPRRQLTGRLLRSGRADGHVSIWQLSVWIKVGWNKLRDATVTQRTLVHSRR